MFRTRPYHLFTVVILLSLFSCKKEKPKEQWISLFNGKNLDNWHVKINGFELGDNAFNTFRVKDSALVVNYDNYSDFKDYYGHIFYKDSFSNYRIKFQYRFIGPQAPGGQAWATKNSGVMLHCQSPESMGINQGFPVSLEAQLLGGIEAGVERPTANLCTPGIHVTLNDKLETTHCINSTSKTFYGEEWINIEVEVHNDSLIKHFVNGKEVIAYSNPIIGGEYNTLLDKEGQKVKGGFISFQSESHPIEFKNILLLNLD